MLANYQDVKKKTEIAKLYPGFYALSKSGNIDEVPSGVAKAVAPVRQLTGRA